MWRSIWKTVDDSTLGQPVVPIWRCDLITDDIVEAYLLGRLPGQKLGLEDDPELQSVAEHLLWCEACQNRAEAPEEVIKELQSTLLRSLSKPTRRPRAKTRTAGM